ncbi:unnamed protein product [Chrysodeixis includens]|uniref:Phosphoribulokinase/uridine kinase domain-containing protein n=1 Tax=Chrysodeixis includens TaxID=689277 RepID=A0A9P0BWU0_CHRIL|nr:unnamed protein product [Chrysodeixis includens]
MGVTLLKPRADMAAPAAAAATQARQWVVIGISGVTCGGKTTLASRLRETLAPVAVLHQDKYFLPDDSPKHVPVAGLSRRHNNYDILSALDMEAMLRDVRDTLAGNKPAPDHSAPPEARAPAPLQLPGKSFLILEGFTILNYEPIMELCDLRYYLTLEYNECLARRVFRLYDPPDVDGYFDKCVWPEHLKYKAQLEKDSRVCMLDGTRQDSYDVVMADIRAFVAR